MRGLEPGRHGRRAMTLIEVMVVMAVLGVILIVISALFFRGRDALRLATEKVETAGGARRALDALQPLALSAIRAGGSEPMVVFDLTPEQPADACHLDVTSRENFLHPDYSPSLVYRPLTAGQPFRFRVAFEPDEAALKLYLLRDGEDVIDDDTSPRLLGRNIAGCSLRRLSESSISITLTGRAERPDERRPGGVTTTTVSGVLTAPGSYR